MACEVPKHMFESKGLISDSTVLLLLDRLYLKFLASDRSQMDSTR